MPHHLNSFLARHITYPQQENTSESWIILFGNPMCVTQTPNKPGFARDSHANGVAILKVGEYCIQAEFENM